MNGGMESRRSVGVIKSIISILSLAIFVVSTGFTMGSGTELSETDQDAVSPATGNPGFVNGVASRGLDMAMLYASSENPSWIPEHAVIGNPQRWDAQSSNWLPLEGDTHSHSLQSWSEPDTYRFDVVTSGYLYVVLVPASEGLYLQLVQDSRHVAMSEINADGSHYVLHSVDPGEYKIEVRRSIGMIGEPYTLVFQSPSFTHHTLAVSADGNPLQVFQVGFTPPTVVSEDRAVGTLWAGAGTLDFCAFEAVYSFWIIADHDGNELLLFCDGVDFTSFDPAEFSFHIDQLHTMSFVGQGNDPGPEPSWVELGLLRDGHRIATRGCMTFEVKTNVPSLVLDHYSLCDLRDDERERWDFEAGTTVETQANPSVELWGPLSVSFSSQLPFGTPGTHIDPHFECTLVNGHRLSGVYTRVGNGYSSRFRRFLLLDPTGEELSASVLLPGFIMPKSLDSGVYTLRGEWDTGAYGGILSFQTSLDVDGEAPVVRWVGVEPPVVAPLDRLTVYIDATDDYSGLDMFDLVFRNAEHGVSWQIYHAKADPQYLDEALNRYALPWAADRPGLLPGLYALSSAAAIDTAGNRGYYGADPECPEVSIQVTHPTVFVSPSEEPARASTQIQVSANLLKEPLAQARVVLSGPGVDQEARTDTDGVAGFTVTPTLEGPVGVKVWTERGFGPVGASLTVTPALPGDVFGIIVLGGRSDHSGALITVEGTDISVSSGPNGAFAFSGLPAGDVVLVITKDRYLIEKPCVTVAPGPQATEVEVIRLRAGDVDGSNTVDLLDLTLLAASYRAKAGVDERYDERRDFNDDGHVDIADLAILATNYGQIGD